MREIPVLAMLTAEPGRLHARAEQLAAASPAALRAELRSGESAVGGGAFPPPGSPLRWSPSIPEHSDPTDWHFGCGWESPRSSLE